MVLVAIVNYGVGNLKSVKKALERAGAAPIITSDSGDIARADAIVLPGVGSFKSAMDNLKPIAQPLREVVERGRPVLGICLGLQLFFKWSEECGGVEGLGFIDGFVDRLPPTVKTPHIGWNTVNFRRASPLIDGVGDGEYFYFVHSYKAQPRNSGLVVATTSYSVEFPSIIEAKPLLFGTQFHPEKSSKPGLTMIRNFVELARR